MSCRSKIASALGKGRLFRTCQLGDDPGTYGQYNELQLIECAADSGSFTIGFRQGQGPKRPIETTVNIAANATAEAVERAIENLYGIDDVEWELAQMGVLQSELAVNPHPPGQGRR